MLLEKEMAIHSSILAWRIPWTEGPGRLQSMGSQRVEHDWVTITISLCPETLLNGLLVLIVFLCIDYYQQLYANKMDNVEEMDKFIEKYNFPKLDQGRTRKS